MTKQDMMEMRLNGCSYGEIAVAAQVSRQRVQQILSPPMEIKSYIRRLANDQCMSCLIPVGSHGHVHHRGTKGLSPENYQDIENLQYLCASCHRLSHGGDWVSRHRSPPSSRSVSVVLDTALFDCLKARATREERTVRNCLRRILREALADEISHQSKACARRSVGTKG